jgi:hypothetical protein
MVLDSRYNILMDRAGHASADAATVRVEVVVELVEEEAAKALPPLLEMDADGFVLVLVVDFRDRFLVNCMLEERELLPREIVIALIVATLGHCGKAVCKSLHGGPEALGCWGKKIVVEELLVGVGVGVESGWRIQGGCEVRVLRAVYGRPREGVL